MRTMIGKRIGPVPIALVAVLALAAFISAGLWLVPNNGAQANNHDLPDLTIDVGEDDTITAADVLAALGIADTEAGVTYTIASDQDGTGQPDGSTETYDINGGIHSGTAVSIAADGAITIAAGTQPLANQPDPTAKITVMADRDASAAGVTPVVTGIDKETSFNLTIVQNPIEADGVEGSNPSGFVSDSKGCQIFAEGATLTAGGDGGDTDGDTGAIERERSTITGNVNWISGGACTTTKDSVDVVVNNIATAATVHYVYVTGGSKFKKVMPDLAKDGLSEHILVVAAQTPAIGTAVPAVPGKQTIPVSKSMASKGVVYVIGYAAETDESNKIDDNPTFQADADYVVKVVFLEPPDSGKSVVESGAKPAEGVDFAASEELDTSGDARVQVTVKDENGTAIEGVNVDFRLVDADSAIKFSNERQILLSSSNVNGIAMADVMGLPKEDAARIGVEVSIGGGDIKRMVYLIRKGDPASVMITGYADCDKKNGCDEATAEMPIVEATGGSFFIRAIATDSAMNYLTKAEASLMVEPYDDASDDVITINHIDTAEEISMWWEALDCALMNDVVMPMGNEPAVGPDNATSPYCKHYPGTDFPASSILSDAAKMVVDAEAMRWYEVTINDDAEPAADDSYYAIKATAGTGSDKVMSDKVGFAVLGGIDMLALTGPERLGSSQIVPGFSVTATAEGGGVPGNIKGQMVSITFAPSDAASVVGSTDDMVTLDAMGMASFSILVTPSRLDSDNLIVIASHGSGDSQTISTPLEVMHRQVITGPTNRAPSAVGSVSDIMMTLGDAPMTVTAGFADADGDTLGYSVMSSDTAVATATSNGGGSVTVTAVGAGEATITVTASDGTATAEQTFMVTVSAPVDMTLGGVMNLMATPGDEQVMLSWTAGANADRHWIAGIKQSELDAGTRNDGIWMEAENADSHTVTGLTNGEEYVFLVISGQTMDGVTTWYSSWSNRATATPMAASSGGPSNPFG